MRREGEAGSQVGDLACVGWLETAGEEARLGGEEPWRCLGLQRVPSQFCATAFRIGREQSSEGLLRQEAAFLVTDSISVPHVLPPQC